MLRILIMAAIAVLAMSTATMATINDDIDPQNSVVHVGLVNPDPVGYTGTVTVAARLSDGDTAQALAGYHIEADGSLTVTTAFDEDVVEVLDVIIIEFPDLIP